MRAAAGRQADARPAPISPSRPMPRPVPCWHG